MLKPKCKKCFEIITPGWNTLACSCGNIVVSELKPEGYNCSWIEADTKFEDNIELVYEDELKGEVTDAAIDTDGVPSGDTDKA